MPLRELVTRHVSGETTDGLLALTADDAYASWQAAAPYLSREAIPLTVFAVSDALATGSSFWWDRCEELACSASPGRWRQFEDDCGLPEAYRRGQPADGGPMRPLRQWTLAEHAGRWPGALEGPLARLEGELGRRTPQRSMTEAELSAFAAHSGAEIGVHTATHAALPFLSDDEVITDIRRGYDDLRVHFPAVVPYLAIPFGLFDSRTAGLAARAGMTVSLTLEGHPLDRRHAAEMGVPRHCVVREQGPGVLSLKASRLARFLWRSEGDRANPYPVLPSPTS